MLSGKVRLDGLHKGLSQYWYEPVRLIAQEKGAILAVSGGPDSLSMLAGLALMRHARLCRTPLLVATVDHGLRPESGEDARRVMRISEMLGIPCVLKRLDPGTRDGNLHDWARRERYAFFSELAQASGGPVLTAHTAEDQAETVLMRVARGAGSSGLTGIRPAIELGGQRVLRPFLNWPRARLHAVLEDVGLEAVDDPSNADPRFTRSRFRKWLAQAPTPDGARGIAEGLAHTARIAAAENEALDYYADQLLAGFEGHQHGYLHGILDSAVPQAVLSRALHAAVARVARHGSKSQRFDLGQAMALADAITGDPTGVWVGAGATIRWQGQDDRSIALEAYGEAGRSGFPRLIVEPGDTVMWDDRFRVTNRSDRPLLVRTWGAGLQLPSGKRVAPPKGLPKRLASTLPVTCSADDQRLLLAVPEGLEGAFGVDANPSVQIAFAPYQEGGFGLVNGG